jgi:hypothetical protein
MSQECAREVLPSRWLSWIIFNIAALAFVAAQSGFARAETSVVKGSLKCGEQGDCYISDMEIRGEIDDSTVEQVSSRLDELHKVADLLKKPIHPFSVWLDSPGGSISAAMKIGRLLRRETVGANVALKSLPAYAGQCVSACVLIYAGATHRSFNEHFSKLGIHRPYLEVPQQELPSGKMQEVYRQTLQDVRAYMREMNVSERLAEAMFRVEPEKARFLTEKAAADYGLTEWDPVYNELADIEEAKKLGLKRQVFMERRSQAISGCSWLKPSINEPFEPWLNCYDGVMTGGRAPRAPAYVAPRGAPDLSSFGTPVDHDPLNWKRYPF